MSNIPDDFPSNGIPPPLNLAEAIAELDSMPADSDQEWAHGAADKLLLKYLTENGAKELAEAFARCRDRVGFWYA